MASVRVDLNLVNGETVDADLEGAVTVADARQRVADALKVYPADVSFCVHRADGEDGEEKPLEDGAIICTLADRVWTVVISSAFDPGLVVLENRSDSPRDEERCDAYHTSTLLYSGKTIWQLCSQSTVLWGASSGVEHAVELTEDKRKLKVAKTLVRYAGGCETEIIDIVDLVHAKLLQHRKNSWP